MKITAAADNIKPYDFNVYASGDIGSSSQYYGSDFQGGQYRSILAINREFPLLAL